MCGQWANEKGSKSAVLEKREKERSDRETCHFSVNGEHSVREPLSNNSPVSQPCTCYMRKRKSHKPLFMLHERGRNVSLVHIRFYVPGAVNRTESSFDIQVLYDPTTGVLFFVSVKFDQDFSRSRLANFFIGWIFPQTVQIHRHKRWPIPPMIYEKIMQTVMWLCPSVTVFY